jgi:hypothetical protein
LQCTDHQLIQQVQHPTGNTLLWDVVWVVTRLVGPVGRGHRAGQREALIGIAEEVVEGGRQALQFRRDHGRVLEKIVVHMQPRLVPRCRRRSGMKVPAIGTCCSKT